MSPFSIFDRLMHCPLAEATMPELPDSQEALFCRQMLDLFLRAKQEPWQDIKTEVRDLRSQHVQNDLYAHWIAKVGITAIFAEKCAFPDENSIFEHYIEDGLRIYGDLSFVSALPPRPRLKLSKLLLECLPKYMSLTSQQEVFNIWRHYPALYNEVLGFKHEVQLFDFYFKATLHLVPRFKKQLNSEEKGNIQLWLQDYIYHFRSFSDEVLPKSISTLQKALSSKSKRGTETPLTRSQSVKAARVDHGANSPG